MRKLRTLDVPVRIVPETPSLTQELRVWVFYISEPLPTSTTYDVISAGPPALVLCSPTTILVRVILG
jgi:hypothetical protein